MNWEMHDIITLGVLFAAGVGNFFFLRYFVKDVRDDLSDLKDKTGTLEVALALHEKDESAHKDKIKNNKSALDKKVDLVVCKLTHETLNKQLSKMCKEIENLNTTLAPLSRLTSALEKIEEKLSGV